MHVNETLIRKHLQKLLAKSDLENWFKIFTVKHNDSNNYTLFFPNKFIKDWVSTHYIDQLHEAIKQLSGQQHVYICFDIMTEQEIPIMDEVSASQPDDHHTFENFIIGKTNEMAHIAALKVCNTIFSPIFNPLFIYGEPGVGKSHLLSAIMHKVKKTHPKLNVYYMTAENFMYTFIKALQDNSIMSFKDGLRDAKLFLVDDVQFMMGKGSTQEEFFHTFNFLKEQKCQIVLSSDKSPNQLERLEDRLRSRLGGGLTVEIHQPNYELRLSILIKKAEVENITVSREVLEFLADNIKGNIRDLEGAWLRLMTYSQWMNEPLTLELVHSMLKDSLASYKREVGMHEIQAAVCNFYGVEIVELTSSKRDKSITKARHISMFLIRELTKSSLNDIGNAFGGKDHSSVLYAVEKMEKMQKTDLQLKNEIELIRKNVKSIIG